MISSKRSFLRLTQYRYMFSVIDHGAKVWHEDISTEKNSLQIFENMEALRSPA